MSKRQKFINSIIHVIAHNRDGSYRTRADRQTCLLKIAQDIYSAGFQLDHVRYTRSESFFGFC